MVIRSHTGHRCGEAHYRARLSDDQVREMRRLYEDWKAKGLRKGYATLADIFGCGESTARDMGKGYCPARETIRF